jgi:hypothetical protein
MWKRRWLLSLVALAITLATVALVFYFNHRRTPPPYVPSAAEAVEWVEIGGAKPVTAEILDRNTDRKAAGMCEVGPDWRMAQTGMVVMDGPSYLILLDSSGRPAIVIETYEYGRGIRSISMTEFEVSDDKLNGKAATWLGSPRALFTVQTYKDNHVDGRTFYFGADGKEICRCEFRQDQPWTGRVLDRFNFDQCRSDVSYRDGAIDGEEWLYDSSGRSYRLRTFKKGVQDGPERQYNNGTISYEMIYRNDKL